MSPSIQAFFDQATWTLTYLVYDPQTKDALVIDPVWDYDPAASQLSTESLDTLTSTLQSLDLKLHYILETHAHADHVSGSQVLKQRFPGSLVGIGARITEVQAVFKDVFHLPSQFPIDGRQFDVLLTEGQDLQAGSLTVHTLFTPGHTPACATYRIGDALFTGDALFMPDYGTGRCDFPSGSAADLYESIHEKLYRLPDDLKVYTGHDYLPNGRPLRFMASLGEQKRSNIQLNLQTSREQFVAFREARDKTLAAPRLLLPSVQINIDAGHIPSPETNQVSYLKIPLRSKR